MSMSNPRQGRGPMPVTQEWVHGLSFMQQTVLLTAVRGPDGLPKYGSVKMLLRWFRRCTLISSLDGEVLDNPHDPRGGSFMGPSVQDPDIILEQLDALVDDYIRTLDAIPHHFQLHFMHAAEIVGWYHPTPITRHWWRRLYVRLVHDMHLLPETKEDLDNRLGDTRAGWLARADTATTE